jgi:HNH endonuclease
MGASYREVLDDPRWQRKRLEIMQRDGWACVTCGSTTQTLNVHHKVYRRGKLPWEYDGADLLTLCRGCHEGEHAVELPAAPLSSASDDEMRKRIMRRIRPAHENEAIDRMTALLSERRQRKHKENQ